MSEQADMIDWIARARATDPQTSHEAARSVDAERLQRVVLDTLRENGPRTTEEIADISGELRISISPRMVQLERAGLVRRTEERRRGSSGRSQQVWALT